ncbi:MAG: hypothetical protein AAFR83_26985, partial [Cyanobacteria bacterium J06629_18]
MAHIAGKTNTAADFLSRLEYLPKEKIQLKIRDDIKITPIEVNIQNFGTAEEDQIFFEPDDDVTEDQLWERKRQIREANKPVPAQIDLNELTPIMSADVSSDATTMFANPNGMQIEQMKDPCLRNLKLKLSDQPFDLSALENDTRWLRYKQNLDRITIKNELLAQATEFANEKFYQHYRNRPAQ